jgi:hypothetical protein
MSIRRHLTPGNILAVALIGWFLLRHSSLHLPEGLILAVNGLLAILFLVGLGYGLVGGATKLGRVFWRVFSRGNGDKTAQN